MTDPSLRDFIEAFIASEVENAEGETPYRRPLVGFADAADPGVRYIPTITGITMTSFGTSAPSRSALRSMRTPRFPIACGHAPGPKRYSLQRQSQYEL